MLVIGLFTYIIVISLRSINIGFNIDKIQYIRLTSIIILYSIVLTFNTINTDVIGNGYSLYNNIIQVTNLTNIFDIIILLVGILIVILSWANINNNNNNINNNNINLNINNNININNLPRTEYSLIILFTVLGGLILVSSYNLVTIYLGIELQSFAVYILATLYREKLLATSAGLKYYLLGGLSSALILFGIALIYTSTGIISLNDLFILSNQFNNDLGLLTGTIILIVGLLFKVSAAPFHSWAPDVYSDVPTVITIWLNIVPKLSLLIVLLIIPKSNIILIVLLISSILSLIIGSFIGLVQTSIKRLLAYSTVSHIGFILLALSINTQQSIISYLFYLIQYTFTTLNIFIILLAIGYIIYNNNNNNNSDINKISELSSQFIINPLLALSFGISLYSLAGIPPLIGFYGKLILLSAAIDSGYYFISLVAILTSIISAGYYLKLIQLIFFNNNINNNNNNNNINRSQIILTNGQTIIISILTLIICLFIFKPIIIINSANLLAIIIYDNG